jgi:diguanylate cyclase
MIPDQDSLHETTRRPPLLEIALERNHYVRVKMESCAAQLSTINKAVKRKIVAGTSVLRAEKVLAQSENVEDCVQAWMSNLLEINNALSQEISDRDQLNDRLINTLQKLSGDQTALSSPKDIWTIATKVIEEAKNYALHDCATGLPNRQLFNDRLKQALSLAKRRNWDLAVLFIDLDSFKLINDTYGHTVGDMVLQTVAQRLEQQARGEDTICRYGGDEFLYLLVNPAGSENTGRITNKLFALISQPLIIDDLMLTIKPSIGIAIYPENGISAVELITNADAAMYHAKEAKTGPVFFKDDFLL